MAGKTENSDFTGLAILGTILAMIIGVIVHLVMNRRNLDYADQAGGADEEESESEDEAALAEKRPKETKADKKKRKKRNALDRMQASSTDDAGEEEGGEVLTSKQKRKAAQRAERDAYRDELDAQREEADERKKGKSEARLKKEEEKENARKEKEEAERLAQEEKEKKEQEEYDQWKDMFTVEKDGSGEQDIQAESQSLLGDFINHIKKQKVVVLEDLANDFGLKTQEAINRLQNMEKMGMITGLMDDKGKFIYITEDEMQSVADFINRRGRISITDLAMESNKLIDLDPKETEEAVVEINLDDVDAQVGADEPEEGEGVAEDQPTIELSLEDLEA